MAKRYLYAIQDDTGREVCAAYLEPEKLRDVTAQLNESKDVVKILHCDEVMATGSVPPAATELHLHRVPADNKLADPISKRVC